jgi:hypothetical protein
MRRSISHLAIGCVLRVGRVAADIDAASQKPSLLECRALSAGLPRWSVDVSDRSSGARSARREPRRWGLGQRSLGGGGTNGTRGTACATAGR